MWILVKLLEVPAIIVHYVNSLTSQLFHFPICLESLRISCIRSCSGTLLWAWTWKSLLWLSHAMAFSKGKEFTRPRGDIYTEAIFPSLPDHSHDTQATGWPSQMTEESLPWPGYTLSLGLSFWNMNSLLV